MNVQAAKATWKSPSTFCAVVMGPEGFVGQNATAMAHSPAMLVIQRSTSSYPSYAIRNTPRAHSAPTKTLRMGV
jgi:hypothetical protein